MLVECPPTRTFVTGAQCLNGLARGNLIGKLRIGRPAFSRISAVGPSLGHHPPARAVDLANRFSPAWHELALRAYTSGISALLTAERRERGYRGSARTVRRLLQAWRDGTIN